MTGAATDDHRRMTSSTEPVQPTTQPGPTAQAPTPGTVPTPEDGAPHDVVAQDGPPAALQDPARFREVLGHFASGVVVVAAALPSGPLGLTCQSFTSVSLDPPLVSFAVATTSRRYPRIREAGRFCVNVLAEDQEDLSRAFGAGSAGMWEGLHWEHSPLGNPVIGGAHAWIDCVTEAEIPAGDHLIVLGRVVELGAASDRRPLLFYRGTYTSLPPR